MKDFEVIELESNKYIDSYELNNLMGGNAQSFKRNVENWQRTEFMFFEGLRMPNNEEMKFIGKRKTPYFLIRLDLAKQIVLFSRCKNRMQLYQLLISKY